MPDMDLHNAGRAIMDSGLVDAVRREGDTNRNRGQDNGGDEPPARQARETTSRERRHERRRAEREAQAAPVDDLDDHDTGDGDTFGGEEIEEPDQDDSDADTSTPDQDEADDADEGDEDSEGADEDADTQKREPEFEVTINGQKSKVPLSELLSGYQRNKALAHKEQAQAARSKQLNALHAQAAQDYAQRHNNLTTIMQGLERMLVGGLSDERLAQLRQSDPNAWIAARLDLQDRTQKVRDFLGQLLKEQEGAAGTSKQTTDAETRLRMENEMELLKRQVPDWYDAQGAPKSAAKVAKFLEASGFAPQEYSAVYDHRMLAIAYKAMRYDELTQKRPVEPRREAKPARKVHKPGPSQMQANRGGQQRIDRNAFSRDKQKAAKSGDVRDAARAITHMLGR